MRRNILYFVLFIFLIIGNSALKGQENLLNQNGFNRFYYPNGQVSSEGNMVDGKPDGFWKTYYVSGVLKSEGNRKNNLLDSIWVFYSLSADTIKKINYIYGKKNGYYYTYDYQNINKPEGYIYSRELFVNDMKEGKSFYYYDN